MVKKEALASIYYPLSIPILWLFGTPESLPLLTIVTFASLESWRFSEYLTLSAIAVLISLPFDPLKLFISSIVVFGIYILLNDKKLRWVDMATPLLCLILLKFKQLMPLIAIILVIYYIILNGDYRTFNVAALAVLAAAAYMLITAPEHANEIAVESYYLLVSGVFGMLVYHFKGKRGD